MNNLHNLIQSSPESEKIASMLSIAFDLAKDMIFITDANGMVFSANSSFKNIVGVKESNLKSNQVHWSAFFSESDQGKISDQIALRSVENAKRLITKIRCSSGLSIPLECKIITSIDGSFVFAGSRLSITEYTLSQLKSSDFEYRTLVNNTKDIVYTLSTDGTILFLNPSFQKITGWRCQEWIGCKFHSLLHPEDRELGLRRFEAIMKYGSSQSAEILRLQRKDGSYSHIDFHSFRYDDSKNDMIKISGTGRDISSTVEELEKFKYYALHDDLCEIPNRKYFRQKLEEAFQAYSERNDLSIAVVFLDLDRFKYVNDTLGHLMGNEVIRIIGTRLKSCLQKDPNVFFGRFGGDEFGILIRDFRSLQSLVLLTENLRNELQSPINLSDGNKVSVSISFGLALMNNFYKDADEILRDADIALYNVKSRGGNGYDIFIPQMYSNIKSIFHLEGDLREAIKNEEFQLYFQPIWSARTKRITCFEALLRWEHKKLGFVPTSEFIAIAEESGQILEIGKAVIKMACIQLQKFQSINVFVPISINISPTQFFRQNVLETIHHYAAQYNVSPNLIRIEILEGTAFSNLEQSIKIMQQLKNSGFQIYLDDFGTGYSSLNYLLKFPINALKIDKSFIEKIESGEKGLEIIQTIVQLGKKLGIQVIAEGVESRKAYKTLKNIGCDLMQGYLIGKPLSAEKTMKLNFDKYI
ncbi:sensor domain-containing protein [Leptospira perolatii]|nr:bifunctional diguanylate cyclase/phosphodiesterase [Leptospira perolatii]